MKTSDRLEAFLATCRATNAALQAAIVCYPCYHLRAQHIFRFQEVGADFYFFATWKYGQHIRNCKKMLLYYLALGLNKLLLIFYKTVDILSLGKAEIRNRMQR